MPEIFTKDAKINVIEYGEHVCMMQDLQQTMSAIKTYFKNLLNTKKA